jgi:hypothetical protein
MAKVLKTDRKYTLYCGAPQKWVIEYGDWQNDKTVFQTLCNKCCQVTREITLVVGRRKGMLHVNCYRISMLGGLWVFNAARSTFLAVKSTIMCNNRFFGAVNSNWRVYHYKECLNSKALCASDISFLGLLVPNRRAGGDS